MKDIIDRITRKFSNPLQKLERIVRQTGKVHKLQRLIEHHPEIKNNLDTIRFKGFTCLHLCCLHGFEDCVEYLLNKVNVDSNVVTLDDGSTPLHMTCWSGNLYIILMLSQGSTNNSCVNRNGFTPLHYACAGGHAEVYEFLLDHGADLNARTYNDGFTPLLIASFNGQLNAVQYLIEYCDVHVDEVDAKGRTSLMIAISAGNLRLIRYLLKAGADLNTIDDEGKKPINHCKSSNDNQSKRLLESYIKNGLQAKDSISMSSDSIKSPNKLARKGRRSYKTISSGSSTSSGSSDTPNNGTLATASTSRETRSDSSYSSDRKQANPVSYTKASEASTISSNYADTSSKYLSRYSTSNAPEPEASDLAGFTTSSALSYNNDLNGFKTYDSKPLTSAPTRSELLSKIETEVKIEPATRKEPLTSKIEAFVSKIEPSSYEKSTLPSSSDSTSTTNKIESSESRSKTQLPYNHPIIADLSVSDKWTASVNPSSSSASGNWTTSVNPSSSSISDKWTTSVNPSYVDSQWAGNSKSSSAAVKESKIPCKQVGVKTESIKTVEDVKPVKAEPTKSSDPVASMFGFSSSNSNNGTSDSYSSLFTFSSSSSSTSTSTKAAQKSDVGSMFNFSTEMSSINMPSMFSFSSEEHVKDPVKASNQNAETTKPKSESTAKSVFVSPNNNNNSTLAKWTSVDDDSDDDADLGAWK